MNTKEVILLEALKQFSQRGYEAVSMRDIAKQIGITQGALYKHYASKQDIFDSIIEKMEMNDSERARMHNVPEGIYADMEEAYQNTQMEQLNEFAEAQFRYWTEDEFASNFRKMITIEQYTNPIKTALYQQYLSSGIIGYVEELLQEVSVKEGWKQDNLKHLALEYFAPIYMLMNLYDGTDNKDEPIKLVREHLARFNRAINYKKEKERKG